MALIWVQISFHCLVQVLLRCWFHSLVLVLWFCSGSIVGSDFYWFCFYFLFDSLVLVLAVKFGFGSGSDFGSGSIVLWV